MVSLTSFNYNELENEFLNRVRSVSQSFDKKSRVEVLKKTLVYDINESAYNVDNRVSFIKRVVTLDGNGDENVLLKYGVDYKISFSADKELVFLKDLVDGESFEVEYGNVKSGSGEWVHPDHPLDSITQKTTPRIGFELTSSSSPGGFGGGRVAYDHEIMVVFKIVDVNTDYINDVCQFLRTYLSEYTRTFHNFRYIRPMNYQSTRPFNDGSQNTKSKFLQFIIEGKKEVVELKELV